MTFGSRRTSSGRALGDLLAVVEHRDPVADAHDHLHVVLDEEDRQAELAPQLVDQRHHLGGLARVHARRSARPAAGASGRCRAPGRPRAGAGRRTAGSWPARSPRPRRPTRSSSSSARCARADLLASVARRREHRVEQVRLELDVHADEHVLRGGHVLEQADVLERPADAGRDHVVRSRAPEDAEAASRRWYQAGRATAEMSMTSGCARVSDAADDARPLGRGQQVATMVSTRTRRSPPARTTGTAPASRGSGGRSSSGRGPDPPEGRVVDARR